MLPLLLALSLTSQITETPAGRPLEAPLAARVLVVLRPSEALPAPVAEVKTEVRRVWQTAPVEFQWASRLPPVDSIVDRVIAVHVTDDPRDGVEILPGALGAVPMVAGRMRQVIYVSPTAVKRLVAMAGVGPADGQYAYFYARTVGRVVAHEMGHLLLRSAAHHSSGLMRESFVARDVVSGDDARFALRGEDVRALQRRLADARTANAAVEPTPIAQSTPSRRR